MPGTSWISGSYLVTGHVKILMYLPRGQAKNFRFFYPCITWFFYVICPREGIFARDQRSRANVCFRGQITQLIWKNPCDNLYIACLVSIIQCFKWFLLIWIGENTQSAHVSAVFWMFTLLGISTFSLWHCVNN